MWIFIGLVVSFGLGFSVGKRNAVNKAAQKPSFILYRDAECMNEVTVKDTPDGYIALNDYVQSVDDDKIYIQHPSLIELVSTADRVFMVLGQDDGVYFLRETDDSKGVGSRPKYGVLKKIGHSIKRNIF